ncbi:MAG: pitrilysin family protein [Deferrisomatales bacterium]
MARPRSLCAVAALALLLGCAAGRLLDPRTATFPAPAFTPPEPVSRRLSGGAPVFLIEDHDIPLVRVRVGFRGGSLYDPPDRAGLARVAELAWRTGGAGELGPEAFDDALEGRGISLSLSVGRETGTVSLSVLPGELETGLDLLAALVREPALRPERVRWAAGQVAERLRREADDPQTLAFRELRRALYRGHPRGVVPTPETVERVGRDDVVRFHRRLVEEGQWAFGVTGDVDPGWVLAALESRLGGLPGSGQGFPPLPPPPEPSPRVVLVPKALPQATLVWARLGPGRLDPAYPALDLLDHVVGSGGFQSRLTREIRSNRGLAYSVGSFYQGLRGFGVLGAFASTRSEAASEVLGLIRETLGQVAASGISREELERARSALVNRYVFRYEDPAAAVGEQVALALDGLPRDLPLRYVEELRRVDLEEANRVARSWYDVSRGVVVVVGDVDPEAAPWKIGVPVEVGISR